MKRKLTKNGLPPAQGLYDPAYEHDACGIGFVANVRGAQSHEIIRKGIQVLINLTHRGACGCDPETGDGAGILIQIPHKFFERECGKLGFALPAPAANRSSSVLASSHPVDPSSRTDSSPFSFYFPRGDKYNADFRYAG